MRLAHVLVFVALASSASLGCAALSGLGSLQEVDCVGAECDGGSDTLTASSHDGGPSGDGAAFAPDDGGDASVGDGARDDAPSDGSIDAAGDAPNDAQGGDAQASDAGDASAVDAGACPGTAGPAPVRIDGFCVDSTEVTNAQYAQFLAAKGSDVSGQPASCAWNGTYTPSSKWPYTTGTETQPVGYVDWCDAYAYCAWAGKRLCGAIGGGPTPFASFASAQSSQWFNACSNAGATTYPYGSTYQATYCNGKDTHNNVLLGVGSMSTCQSFPGVYDMSGNTWEWEDSCSASSGSGDACRARGGSTYSFSSSLECGVDSTSPRNATYSDLGFRCCSP